MSIHSNVTKREVAGNRSKDMIKRGPKPGSHRRRSGNTQQRSGEFPCAYATGRPARQARTNCRFIDRFHLWKNLIGLCYFCNDRNNRIY